MDFSTVADLDTAYNEATSAPAEVPQYSRTFVSRPLRSNSTRACKKTIHRVPPPQKTSLTGFILEYYTIGQFRPSGCAETLV